MQFDKIYDTYELNEEKLLQEGFKKEKSTYQKRIPLKDKNFEVLFLLTTTKAKVKVYDKEFNEEYLPFYVENEEGEFVSKIKEEVDLLWKDIVKKCFEKEDVPTKILNYVKKKYKTTPVYPWKSDYVTCPIKNKEGKWYGIMMEIPYERLGIKKSGIIPILNLKNTEEKVLELIDRKLIFPAYHMNKKYWYTVILTKNINMLKLEKLIDESYQLVTKEKKL